MGRGTQLLPIFGGHPRQFSPADITSAISRAAPRDPLAQSYIPPNRCFCVVYVCCSAMQLVVWYCTWGGIRCRAVPTRARVESHDVVRVLVLALAGCEKKKKFPTVLSVHFVPHRSKEELRARLCERVPIMALMSSKNSVPRGSTSWWAPPDGRLIAACERDVNDAALDSHCAPDRAASGVGTGRKMGL